MKPAFIAILVTASSKAEAETIATALLQNKLIACANIIEGVTSLFWWEGKIDRGQEILLILKTQKSKFKSVASKIKTLHSYSVPEIIAVPILEGNSDYLKWIKQSISQ